MYVENGVGGSKYIEIHIDEYKISVYIERDHVDRNKFLKKLTVAPKYEHIFTVSDNTDNITKYTRITRLHDIAKCKDIIMHLIKRK